LTARAGRAKLEEAEIYRRWLVGKLSKPLVKMLNRWQRDKKKLKTEETSKPSAAI
jgi:hypothetical protein